jgi:hypothetical protein
LAYRNRRIDDADMDIMTTKRVAKQWGVTVRRVQSFCERGMIGGAKKLADIWALPLDTENPSTAGQRRLGRPMPKATEDDADAKQESHNRRNRADEAGTGIARRNIQLD